MPCVRNSGQDAVLTCHVCVDCYPSPIQWLSKKKNVEIMMKGRGFPDVQIEMEYLHAGQCPVCEIRRGQNEPFKAEKDRCKEGLGITYDELLEIRARKIAGELELQRKRQLQMAERADYEAKMKKALENVVIKVEDKHIKLNTSDAKIKRILRKPSFIHSVKQLEDANGSGRPADIGAKYHLEREKLSLVFFERYTIGINEKYW